MSAELKENTEYRLRSHFRIVSEKRNVCPGNYIASATQSPYYPTLAATQVVPLFRDAETHTPPSIFKECPICHATAFRFEEKRFLGLLINMSWTCKTCATKFKSADSAYSLDFVRDTSNSVWQKYGHKILAPHEWDAIAQGGMSDTEQKDHDIAEWMLKLRAGTVHIRSIQTSVSILPGKGEEIVCALPGIILMESRSVRVTRGGYAGPGIRVAKGVSFRVGRFGSTSLSRSEIRNVDRGTLTVTNKRIVFSGGMKTVNIEFAKIIGIEGFDDGIAVRRSTAEKTQYFTWPNKSMGDFEIKTNGRIYTKPFDGSLLATITEGLVTRAHG